MRYVKAALAVAITIALIITPIISLSFQTPDPYYLIYGSTLCPHCMALEDFMKTEFPNNFSFCPVNTDDSCAILYQLLHAFLGLPMNSTYAAVPFTLVVREGKLVGIVIGELENKTFWENFETSDRISIYFGEYLRGYITTNQTLAAELFVRPAMIENSTLRLVATKLVAAYLYAYASYIMFDSAGETGMAKLMNETKDAILKAYVKIVDELLDNRAPDENSLKLLENASDQAKRAGEEGTDDRGRKFAHDAALYIIEALKTLTGSIPSNNNGNNGNTEPPVPQTGNIVTALLTAVGLASIDAFNPCFLTLYAVILLSVTAAATTPGRTTRKLLAVGLSFTAAVFIGYYIMGVGLSVIFENVPRTVFPAIAFIAGAWMIYSGLRDRGECKICREGERYSAASAAAAFALGLTATFTLLPCTAGPYLFFTSLASSYGIITRLGLLAVYNIVFVLPLIIILVAVAAAVAKVEGIKEWVARNSYKVSVVGGAALIGIGIYTLAFLH